MTRRSGSRFAVLALVAGAALLPSAVRAQSVEMAQDGTVSLVAEGTALGSLLAGLGERGRFNKLVVDPKVESRPVTITLDRATVRQAVVQILNAADVNYALTSDDDGRSMRLIAGEVAFVAEQQRMLAHEDRAADPAVENVRAENAAPREEAGTADAQNPVGMPIDGSAVAPLDQAQQAFQLQQLQEALTAPVVRPPAGSVVELPFTGPDGRPLTTIVQPKPAVVPLPFPATAPAPSGQASPAAPQPIDPQTRQLIEALTPPPVTR
jgi:hypothetical protein